MTGEHYGQFIHQAFIKPIRSVLIVDDDYPTLEEVLGNQSIILNDGERPASDKSWYRQPEPIRTVLNGLRTPGRPLILDIHDGANVNQAGEMEVAS